MFTGLVQATGAITALSREEGGVRLSVDVAALAGPFEIGDSIALSGVCCTVVTLESGVAEFFLTPETLDRTWLGAAQVGDRLNLEGALRAGQPLGGHIVQGHVDGVGGLTGAIDAEQNTTAEDLSRLQQLSDQLRADSAHSGEILQRDKECLRLRTAYREPFTLPPKDEEGEKRRAEGVRALRAARKSLQGKPSHRYCKK